MTLERLLALPGPLGVLCRLTYEFCYACLRVNVQVWFRPFFKVRRVGPPPQLPRGGVIFCANHASYLDPAFVQLVVGRRVRFVMTNDFYRRRWGRWFFNLVRAIPVEKGRLAKSGLEAAVDTLRKGGAICIFPEGRLSRDGELSPAQRGVALIARLGHASVVPMGIAGNFEVWPRGACWCRRGNVRVAIGRPIAPPDPAHPIGRSDEQAFADRVLRHVAVARDRARGHNAGVRIVHGSSSSSR